MNTVNVGIIGIGNMGSAHLNCIMNNEVDGMRAIAICDIDKVKLNNIKQMYPNLTVYDDYHALINNDNINSVIIAVPHPLHCDIAVDAFNNQLNVLCEKPIDITVTKALMLNEIAHKSNKIFGVMFNQRTNILFQKARDIVLSGELGEIKRSVWIITNWYRTQHYYNSGDWRATWLGEGGGVLLNQAPHNLDLWQWICGMPKYITAYLSTGKYHNIEVEDEAQIFAEYSNGATGTFITSTGEYPGTNRLEISGTKGKIVLENQLLKHWMLKEDERKVCFNSNESFCNIACEYTETKGEPETAHRGILQNFTNAILKDEKLLAPGYEAINELSISNAAYLSQWCGNSKTEIPFNSKLFDEMLYKKCSHSSYKPSVKNIDNFTSYNPRWKVRW